MGSKKTPWQNVDAGHTYSKTATTTTTAAAMYSSSHHVPKGACGRWFSAQPKRQCHPTNVGQCPWQHPLQTSGQVLSNTWQHMLGPEPHTRNSALGKTKLVSQSISLTHVHRASLRTPPEPWPPPSFQTTTSNKTPAAVMLVPDTASPHSTPTRQSC